jgi:hypothetical protein
VPYRMCGFAICRLYIFKKYAFPPMQLVNDENGLALGCRIIKCTTGAYILSTACSVV